MRTLVIVGLACLLFPAVARRVLYRNRRGLGLPSDQRTGLARQGDYLQTRFFNSMQGNFRFSTGLALHF